MLLGFLLTACADYDCVNQGYAYQPARHWRGASAERPPAAWGAMVVVSATGIDRNWP